MKKALILIFTLFLLSSLSCSTTEQEVSKTDQSAKKVEKVKETIAEDFDLNRYNC